MKDPQEFALEHVKFHEDGKAISYQFKLDGESRIATYRHDGDDRMIVDLQTKPRSRSLIQLVVTQDNARARTPEGEYLLSKKGRVLPKSTDQRSLWIITQHFIENLTTRPQALADRALQELESQDETGTTRSLLLDGIGFVADMITIWQWLWGWFDEDCLAPNQKTICYQDQPDGSEEPIEFVCPCGTPICLEQQMTTEIPIVVRLEDGSTETRSETVYYSQCVCYCQVIEDLIGN